MNVISIIGNLGKDPDLRYTANRVPVCNFSVAVKRPHANDTTDWISCVAWRHNADYLYKYGRKGSRVGITGTLTCREFTDKDGDTHKFYEVVCEDLELLQSRSSESKGSYPAESENSYQEGPGGFEELDEETPLPF